MTVEASVSLFAAWMARSPALLAFGGDSAIELLSAVAVLWRFRTYAQERSEKQVARIAAALLFILAAYVLRYHFRTDAWITTTERFAFLALWVAGPLLAVHVPEYLHRLKNKDGVV